MIKTKLKRDFKKYDKIYCHICIKKNKHNNIVSLFENDDGSWIIKCEKCETLFSTRIKKGMKLIKGVI